MSNATCTVSIPGYTVAKDCTLLCREAKWTDLMVFFVGNYVVHVVTVTTIPGDSIAGKLVMGMFALASPMIGLVAGIDTILTGTMGRSTALQTAARAEALFMVTEISRPSEIHPINRNIIDEAKHSNFRPWSCRTLHGQCKLPSGYQLSLVPSDTTFENDDIRKFSWWKIKGLVQVDSHEREIASGYSLLRILASVVQILFGIVTLYRTRGDQIEKFGYAAFGLTVVPYAWMSLINLCANIVRPEYSANFIVESQLLRELRARYPNTCLVTGTVGTILEPLKEEPSTDKKGGNFLRYVFNRTTAELFCMLVPIAIIGAFSHFSPASSTVAQRVWIMLWLLLGTLLIFLFKIEDMQLPIRGLDFAIFPLIPILFATAIGGFVVVGQMIMQHGICERIPRFTG